MSAIPPCSAEKTATLAAMVAAAVQRFGRLDGAFNNAGVGGEMILLGDLDGDGWARTIGINLTGVFHCIKHEVEYMAAHGGGSIVNTSSGAGVLVSNPAQGDYVAAKAGVLGLTRAAAVDYAKQGIRVNAVLPGLVETGMSRADIRAAEALASSLLTAKA